MVCLVRAVPVPFRAGIGERAMPSKSGKQARLMRAASHNPKIAKASGVPQAVAREFVEADKAKKRALSPAKPKGRR